MLRLSQQRHSLGKGGSFCSRQEELMNFNMTEDEAELLRDILSQNHRELLLEIARAEHHEFKLTLQKTRRVAEAPAGKTGNLTGGAHVKRIQRIRYSKPLHRRP
jgi:hypothetical protein